MNKSEIEIMKPGQITLGLPVLINRVEKKVNARIAKAWSKV